MTHKISITTVEALLLNEALLITNWQNDKDELIAKRLIDKINSAVKKDLNKQKEI